MDKQLTVEIVNSILEGEDSDRTVRISEDGDWVEVITGGFYDEDEPNGEKPGDIVATFRIYHHPYGPHQALFAALEAITGFWPITQYVDQELSRKPKCIIGGSHWPGLVLTDVALAARGYEIDEYPWVKLKAPIDDQPSTENGEFPNFAPSGVTTDQATQQVPGGPE